MPFFVSSKQIDELEQRAKRAESALARALENLEAEKKHTSSEWKAVELLRARSEKLAAKAANDLTEVDATRNWIIQREGNIAQLRQQFLDAILQFRSDTADLKSLARWAE